MTAAEGEELLDVAREAAGAAAAVLLEYRGLAEPLDVGTKSTPTDPVSAADIAAERAIREVLARRRPDDAIVGEEGDDQPGASGLRWVVDPLDGTANYLYDVLQWSVSVACEDHVGVILDPLRDERFEAIAGVRATRDGSPMRGSTCDDLGHALVATGFGYDAEVRRVQGAQVAELLPQVRDIRRLGSAALDLAWSAAGRYDAYYERGVQRWDVAAGVLMCREAGLEVVALAARGSLPAGILVAPAALVEPLLAIVG